MRSLQRQQQTAVPVRLALLDTDTGFLAALLNRTLRVGWEHRILAASAAPSTIRRMRPDVLAVDMSALGARRWEWLERVCQARRSYAVVICSGSSTLPERLLALRLGADGWLEKPCHPEELIARIEAVVRHFDRPRTDSQAPVRVGEVEIRVDQYQAFVGEQSLHLTRRELQLAMLFAASGGKLLARELIYERVWGYEMQRDDRSVDVLVHKLRRKLESASPGWRYILTHPGAGYSLAPAQLAELGEVKEADREPARAKRSVAA